MSAAINNVMRFLTLITSFIEEGRDSPAPPVLANEGKYERIQGAGHLPGGHLWQRTSENPQKAKFAEFPFRAVE